MGKRKRKNKAKQNAKNNSFTSNHSVSNISSQYSSLRNEEISQDFEENIRNILLWTTIGKKEILKENFNSEKMVIKLLLAKKKWFYKS